MPDEAHLKYQPDVYAQRDLPQQHEVVAHSRDQKQQVGHRCEYSEDQGEPSALRVDIAEQRPQTSWSAAAAGVPPPQRSPGEASGGAELTRE